MTLSTLWTLMREYILVNFDLDFLFMKVPTGDELKLPSQQFSEDDVRLFHHVLTCMYVQGRAKDWP
jgi:hypothetical protein